MLKFSHQIAFTLALSVCWMTAVLAQPANPASIIDEALNESGIPDSTQELIREVAGTVYEKPRSAQEFHALLGHLHGTRMTLETTLAGTKLTDEQRQHLQTQLDASKSLASMLQHQLSTGNFATSEPESEPGLRYGPYE